MQGSLVLLNNYVARVISRGPGILSSFSHPSWVVSLVLQNLIGAPWTSYRHMKSIFSGSESALPPGPCLGWVYWCMPCCHIVTHSRGWSEVSFFFRPGLHGKDSGHLLCSSVCGLHCTGPTKHETLAVRAVRCYLDRFAAHRQRCERFLFAAAFSTKELSKSTVSFWLWMPLSRVCRLSVTERSVCIP